MNVRGIDVSHINGHVQWRKLADTQFAFIKATQGLSFNDPEFYRNAVAAEKAGIATGAYHFVNLGANGAAQAQYTIGATKGAIAAGCKLELGIALDLETDPAAVDLPAQVGKSGIRKIVEDFSAVIYNSTGKYPTLYGSPAWLEQWLGTGFGGHPLWVAHYNTKAPRLPAGWDKYAIWQYGDTATFDGITGDVDVNLMHPDYAAQLKLGASAPC